MDSNGVVRYAINFGTHFGTYQICLGLLGKTSDDDHCLSSNLLDNLNECAAKTTKELLHNLIIEHKLISCSPKTDKILVFASAKDAGRLQEACGYFSSKCEIKFVQSKVCKSYLSLAIQTFLEFQIVAKIKSNSTPIFRLKDLFILHPFSSSVNAGERVPAFSIDVLTHLEASQNLLLVELQIFPQSVSYRTLKIPHNYSLEEDDAIRCVVLPSLKMGLIKSYHDRPPEESNFTSWYQYVEFWETQHQISLTDDDELLGFAQVIVNHSSNEARSDVTAVSEETFPVSCLWTETGLSRRDLRGISHDTLIKYIKSITLQIDANGVHLLDQQQIQANQQDETKQQNVESISIPRLLTPLKKGAFDQIKCFKVQEVVEQKKKDSLAQRKGFINSSIKLETEQESLDMDDETLNWDTLSAETTSLDQNCINHEELEISVSFEEVKEMITNPPAGISPISTTGTNHLTTKSKRGTRLGSRLLGQSSSTSASSSLSNSQFKPVVPTKLISDETRASDTPKPMAITPNLNKRKIGPSSVLNKPFTPPRQKIQKTE